jgi:flavin-dependent dehydrogenase
MLQLVTWDAVVVGGGPAGSAFALELARHGRQVALLERAQTTQHKVCGEFLSRETIELLAYLGVDVGAFGGTPINEFRLVSHENRARIPLPFTANALSRYRLDEALLATAERSGVQVVPGARVAGVECVDGAGVAKTADGTWRGRVVALATGKHSLRPFRRPQGSMVGFKMHLASPNAARTLSNVVQLAFFKGGYVGACLVEQSILSIGWVMRPELLHEVGSGWAEQAVFLSKQSSFVAGLLDGASALFQKPVSTAAIPYGFLRTRAIAPTIYPLGDQLAVVPSFTGDGLAIALSSGIAAARAVVAGRPAESFQRAFVSKLRPQFRVAAALGRLLETPTLCGAAVSAARLLPRVAAQMVNATRLRGFEHLTERSAHRLDAAPHSIPVD